MTRATVAGRVILRLLPARRRDWVEALWAESAALAPGRERARWRAGAMWLVAREALGGWRTPGTLAFTVAAVLAAAGCWPGSAANVVTATIWFNVIAVVAVLGGTGWLAGRFFGPARARWLPRAVRAAVYAAILALLPAVAVANRYDYDVVGTHPFLRRYDVVGGVYPGPPFLFIDGVLLVALAGCDVADQTGGYYVKRQRREPSAAALDDAAARQLWEISEQMTGLAPAQPAGT
jgi:hypothetical protein